VYIITRKRPTESDLHFGHSRQGYSCHCFAYDLVETLDACESEGEDSPVFYVTHYHVIDLHNDDTCIPLVQEALEDSGWEFSVTSEYFLVDALNEYSERYELLAVFIHRFEFRVVEGYDETEYESDGLCDETIAQGAEIEGDEETEGLGYSD
jgi:hypothetical protein